MDKKFDNIYRNKTVLVTGHTGFKGSWLTLWLIQLGAKVIGYSLPPPTTPNLFESLNLKWRITHIEGDVTDYCTLESVIEEFKPEFVFHLAAQPLVRASYILPKLTYETNVLGTLNVLECIRCIDTVKVGVIVTSDKCYKNFEINRGYKETDPLGGHDPYSSSKACAELITSAYRDSYGDIPCAISTVRAGNVIGGGDWGEDRLVPDCMRALHERKNIILRNPRAIRPWQYVLEPLFGYLRLGSLMYQHGKIYGEAWNFSPSDMGLTVEEIVNLVINNWGRGLYEIDESSHPHEDKILSLNSQKADKYLDWRPVLMTHEAVKSTVDWYKHFYNNEDIYKYSVKEIQLYETRLR